MCYLSDSEGVGYHQPRLHHLEGPEQKVECDAGEPSREKFPQVPRALLPRDTRHHLQVQHLVGLGLGSRLRLGLGLGFALGLGLILKVRADIKS